MKSLIMIFHWSVYDQVTQNPHLMVHVETCNLPVVRRFVTSFNYTKNAFPKSIKQVYACHNYKKDVFAGQPDVSPCGSPTKFVKLLTLSIEYLRLSSGKSWKKLSIQVSSLNVKFLQLSSSE